MSSDTVSAVRILSIVGARPQFIKVAPICWRAKENFSHEIVHTGQHYDELMSDSIFKDLEITKPIINFEVGSSSHAEQTAKIMVQLEDFLKSYKPDHVIVYGDTNSTLAGALVTSKMNIPTSHVEAGLRSYNRKMPEELNRIVTDHLSDILFAPTINAMTNLNTEGLQSKAIMAGDIMRETIEFALAKSEPKLRANQYIYCTIHRAENTDEKSRLTHILNQLKSSSIRVKLYAHPRLIKKIKDFEINIDQEIIEICSPLPFIENIKTVSGAVGVITDSGGLQKEAYLLGIPCLTIRKETEWEETLTDEWNLLDPGGIQIAQEWWTKSRKNHITSFFGEGKTSDTVISSILEFAQSK